MIRQTTFHLSEKRRGCHLVTQEILEHLQKPLPEFGMLNLFVQHTSCALTINENYDPDVRTDMEAILNHMVKERESYYEHTMEGPDDMPAHAKCSLFGVSLTIPITNGRLNMGTWQGIYLCEFRNYGGSRKIVATIYEQLIMENHSSAKECWIVMSRSKNPPAGVLPYLWTELNKQRCRELENRGLMTQAGRDALERFLSAEESICGIRK